MAIYVNNILLAVTTSTPFNIAFLVAGVLVSDTRVPPSSNCGRVSGMYLPEPEIERARARLDDQVNCYDLSYGTFSLSSHP